jgi:hypothetical protein
MDFERCSPVMRDSSRQSVPVSRHGHVCDTGMTKRHHKHCDQQLSAAPLIICGTFKLPILAAGRYRVSARTNLSGHVVFFRRVSWSANLMRAARSLMWHSHAGIGRLLLYLDLDLWHGYLVTCSSILNCGLVGGYPPSLSCRSVNTDCA